MRINLYPDRSIWQELCKRNTIEENTIREIVSSILENVKTHTDISLYKYAYQFEKVTLSQLEVSKEQIWNAEKFVPLELREAIVLAKRNIEKFHATQKRNDPVIETSKGVKCWRKSVPIEKVGLYIPGGSAPLFSTILMLGIPAKLAGCNEIIICTPPDKTGFVHPAILYTAQLIGIENVFMVGGAQAIAAMAYGTETIPRVYKIFGPGNQYVTKAKELIQQDGIDIDMPAGPSEVLIIADRTSKPEFIATDLLSQAEHGPDSQVILLSDEKSIIDQSIIALQNQLIALPRKDIAKKALKNSRAILLKDISECFDFSNSYAPEHLIIASDQANDYINRVINAGSVFLGNFSCESAGDYASGTNHTLPTNGYAKSFSGISLDSFMKNITFQELSKEGITNIGNAIEIMAEAEELQAHKNAVTIRLKSLGHD